MGGADAAGDWDLSFVTAGILELHVAGTGVHAGCGRDFAGGFGGDDGGMAGLKEGPHRPSGTSPTSWGRT
jgi:hypothetical protein